MFASLTLAQLLLSNTTEAILERIFEMRRLPGLPTKKPHKLLYYCQGHHLATFDEPLFRANSGTDGDEGMLDSAVITKWLQDTALRGHEPVTCSYWIEESSRTVRCMTSPR